jgi:hypothetical protein
MLLRTRPAKCTHRVRFVAQSASAGGAQASGCGKPRESPHSQRPVCSPAVRGALPVSASFGGGTLPEPMAALGAAARQPRSLHQLSAAIAVAAVEAAGASASGKRKRDAESPSAAAATAAADAAGVAACAGMVTLKHNCAHSSRAALGSRFARGVMSCWDSAVDDRDGDVVSALIGMHRPCRL